MHKQEKERVVSELTDRLQSAETLIVADYRGLTMPQIDDLRSKLFEHGARFSVVKNTLTRRAAEAAGSDALLALLDGPSAIAFIESGGDPVAVAKALSDAARTTNVLELKGGVMNGRAITGADVQNLAKLPPADVLHAQMVGALQGPLAQIVAIFSAPARDIVSILDQRIEQLKAQGLEEGSETQGEAGETPAAAEEAPAPAAEATPEEAPAAAATPPEPESETETENDETENQEES